MVSFIIGTVTLPRFPEKITFKASVDKKKLRYPSKKPIVIVYGDDVDILTIEGRLQEAGKTKTQLTTDYITPLYNLRGTEVVIQNSGRQYHNTAFILVDFIYDERPGWSRAYYFRIELWKGEIHIVL